MLPVAPMNAALAGAAKATEVGVSSLARKLSKEGQAEEAQNEQDLQSLKRNEFGPTKSQQEQQTQEAVALARQQAQAARAEAARQRAAQGYLQGAGVSGLADQRIAQTAEQTAGSTRMQVAQQAAAQARQAKLDALGRIRARAEKTEEDVRSIHQAGEKAFDDAGGLGGSGGGSADFSQLAGKFGKG